MKSKNLRLLNLGCSAHCHPEWVNIDVLPAPNVIVHNILMGIPYPDSYFDVVYHSHLLEHFSKDDAARFIVECFRVLKPGGIIRVVVPDLETVATLYLKWLNLAISGVETAQDNYEWMMLEMYDQAVRSFQGGGTEQYLMKTGLRNREFIRTRIGSIADIYWNRTESKVSIWKRVKIAGPRRVMRYVGQRMTCLLLGVLAGKEMRLALENGLLRRSGEIHLWMYDRFSLKNLLEKSGFLNAKACSAMESQIIDFNRYELDVVKGEIRRADSLFMEAVKPENL